MDKYNKELLSNVHPLQGYIQPIPPNTSDFLVVIIDFCLCIKYGININKNDIQINFRENVSYYDAIDSYLGKRKIKFDKCAIVIKGLYLPKNLLFVFFLM